MVVIPESKYFSVQEFADFVKMYESGSRDKLIEAFRLAYIIIQAKEDHGLYTSEVDSWHACRLIENRMKYQDRPHVFMVGPRAFGFLFETGLFKILPFDLFEHAFTDDGLIKEPFK